MNFENQLCRQTGEQPAYIDSEQLLKMQRASLVRIEKNERTLHLLPLFFGFSDELVGQIDSVIQSFGVIQKCHFQTESDRDLSSLVSGMVRTVRGLPLVLKRVPEFGVSSRPSAINARSTYDLVYHIFSEKPLDVKDIAGKIAQAINPAYVTLETGQSAVVCDKAFNNALVLQRTRTYEPAGACEVPPMEEVETPDCSTIEKLAEFTHKEKTDLVKAVMYSVNKKLVFVNIRGDLDVSEEKLRQHLGLVDSPIEVQMATPEMLERHGLVGGYAGLVGLKKANECVVICDNSVKTVTAGVTGANKHGYHFVNYYIPRDVSKDVAKFIQYADVAADPVADKGVVIAQVQDCTDFYPEFLGLDSKPLRIPMYKVTIRMVDLVASTLGVVRKINGAFLINIGKDTTKLDATVAELSKFLPPVAIVVDNRPKPNFGQKMQIAEMAMFKCVIIVSNKLDSETVSVNEKPTKITDLRSLFA